MKLILQIILSLFLSSFTFSQTFWEPTSGPDKGTIWSILTMSNGEILVGTNSGGIYRSADKGNTWLPSSENLNTNTVFKVIRSLDGDILLGTNNGIYRSTNDRRFWIFITAGLPYQFIRVLGVNSENHIFTGMPAASLTSGDGGLYQSMDKGETWFRIALTEHEIDAIGQRPEGGMILFSHISGGTTITTYRYTSDDNGRTWNGGFYGGGLVLSDLVFDSNGNTFWISEFGLIRDGIRVDFFWDCGKANVVVISPDDQVFSAGNQGLCSSENSGDTWIKVDVEQMQINALAFDLDGFLYSGGSDGVIYRSVQAITDVKESDSQAPVSFMLFQNYPNPFNDGTDITYQLPAGRHSYKVTLDIYDLEGRLVNRLVDADQLPGIYSVNWKGTDSSGKPVASNVYYYFLQADMAREIKKLVLLK